MELQVAGFLDNSLVNGEGLRSVVFVSGCSHNCPGCHNKDMQDYKYGEAIDTKTVFEKIHNNMPLIKGVTFSGGEPFEQAEALSELGAMIKAKGLNLWCYTGYTYEFINNNKHNRKGWEQLINNVDVLIDGKFEQAKYSASLKYKGSYNQKIINVKESLEKGEIVVLEY